MGTDKALVMSEKLARNSEEELKLARVMFEKMNYSKSVEHSHNSIQSIIKALLITKNIFVKDNIISPAFTSLREKTSIKQDEFEAIYKHLQNIEQQQNLTEQDKAKQNITSQDSAKELNTAAHIFKLLKKEGER